MKSISLDSQLQSRTAVQFARAIALAVFSLCLCLPASASTIYCFDFENDAIGQSTAFTDVNNGLAASFEDAGAMEGSFMVLPSVFNTLFGNSLYALVPDAVLRIIFSQDVPGVSFAFALGSTGGITVQAFNHGAEQVAQSTSAGTVADGDFAYEGSLTIGAPGGVRSIEVSSTAAAGFVVDNVASVPEPETFVQLGAGLGLLLLARLRRK